MNVTQPKTYAPATRCIYCGSNAFRTKEHIVPYGLGGAWVLPNASCKECQKITTKIENACLRKMFLRTRIQRNVKTRRKKEHREARVRALIITGSKTKTAHIPVKQAPEILVMMELSPPEILLGLEPQFTENVVGARIWARSNIAKWGPPRGISKARLGARLHLGYLARMLAKIAHSFAVAELGESAFQPLLPDLILGKPTWVFTYAVGGTYGSPPPPTTTLHELEIKEYNAPNQTYWVVRMRLFADQGTPVYNVVVGPKL